MSIGERDALDITFSGAGSRTVLSRRRYRWPLLIGRVFADPSRPSVGAVTVQNAAGTVIPGDVVRQQIRVVDGGSARVRGQGATVVSGVSGGDVATDHTRVSVDASSRLVLDPCPRILTRHAHYRQHTQVAVALGGQVVLVDMVVLHPELSDDTFGSYESTVTVTAPGGGSAAVDAQRLEAMPRVRRAPTAFGTVYVVGAGLDTTMTAMTPQLESLSVLTGDRRTYLAVSDLPNEAGWVVRIAASDGGALREVTAAVTAMVDAGTESPAAHIRAKRAIAKQ